MKKLNNTLLFILPLILLMFIFSTTASAVNLVPHLTEPLIATGLSPSAFALSGDSEGGDGIPEMPDFNNDGISDLAIVNYDADTVSIFTGDGDGTFTQAPSSPIALTLGAGPYSLVAGNFNPGTDLFLDLAIANANNNTISILLGDGAGNFTLQPLASVTMTAQLVPYSITTCDFDNDGDTDLAVANLDSDNVSILIGNGDGTFTEHPKSPITISSNAQPASIASGDFDNDFKVELVTANYKLNSVSLISDVNLDTTYVYQTGTAFPVGINPISIATGDFNGDGDLDVATANINGGNVSILLGYGDKTFTPAINYYAGLFPSSITAADFNRDGNIDLVVTNIDNKEISVLYGNGNGRFQYPVTFSTGVYPISSAAGKFNADGDPDLAVANFSDNTVSVFLNNNLPKVKVTGPTILEKHLISDTSFDVTWEADPDSESFTILLSTDNGEKFKRIAKGSKADFETALGKYSYPWTVPIPKKGAMQNCLIKVIGYDADKKMVDWDTSDSTFSIDTVEVTAPNDGDTFNPNEPPFIAGDPFTVTWTTYTTKKTPTKVKISYYSDFNRAWTELVTIDGNPGTYPGIVPDVPSAKSLIMVELLAGTKSLGYDISDDFFTIDPAVTVTAPNGGEEFEVGGALTVTWTTDTSAAVSYVRVSYSTDNGANWTEKVTVAGNPGTYSWDPLPDEPSDNWLVKVELLDVTQLVVFGTDISDDVFSVRPITVTYPNGGEPGINQGASLTIDWTTITSLTVSSVKLYYSSDGGTTWNDIATVAGDPGSYNWPVIANDPSANWLIKVELFDNSNDSLGSDVSDAVFTVNP